MAKSSKELLQSRKIGQYQQWLKGQSDRLKGLPCASANGKYLEGWYSPEASNPDFLTPDQAVELRKLMPPV